MVSYKGLVEIRLENERNCSIIVHPRASARFYLLSPELLSLYYTFFTCMVPVLYNLIFINKLLTTKSLLQPIVYDTNDIHTQRITSAIVWYPRPVRSHIYHNNSIITNTIFIPNSIFCALHLSRKRLPAERSYR